MKNLNTIFLKFEIELKIIHKVNLERKRLIQGLNINILILKMTTQGSKQTWTEAARDAAIAKHEYIKVGDKGGTLALTGAVARWKKHPGDLYIPALRVAGSPADLRQLLGANYDGYAQQAYTAQNYRGAMKAQFDAEVAARQAYKKSIKGAGATSTIRLERLDFYTDKDRLAEAIKKGKEKKTTKASSPRAGSPRRSGKTLMDRLRSLKAGTVLDASNMDLGKGTGIRTIKKPTERSKKIGVQGLDLVSSDAGKYAAAVRMLGSEYEGYIARYASAAVGPVPAPASPSMVPAPATSPLAALPTSPSLGGLQLPMAGLPPAIGSPLGSPSL